MADEQENSETPMSKWSRVFGQMFSERHPEEILKHLNGYNVPTTYSLALRPPIWTGYRLPVTRLLTFFFPPVRAITGDDNGVPVHKRPGTPHPKPVISKQSGHDDSQEEQTEETGPPESPLSSVETPPTVRRNDEAGPSNDSSGTSTPPTVREVPLSDPLGATNPPEGLPVEEPVVVQPVAAPAPPPATRRPPHGNSVGPEPPAQIPLEISVEDHRGPLAQMLRDCLGENGRCTIM